MRAAGHLSPLVLPLSLVLLCGDWAPPVAAAVDTVEDWPAWADQAASDLERIDRVNEGELVFLQEPPATAVHHHRNRILITRQSLQDGWVAMEQCHEQLDRVAQAQIVYHPERTRALEVRGFDNIDAAYVEGSSIQLRGIGRDSRVCARLETRALHALDDRQFELRNGPFMRRFLDGYYPLQLTIQVDHPAQLELVQFSPARQPGWNLHVTPGSVKVEALFEGQLRTRLRFRVNP